MQGLSPRNLKYMRAFAAAWPDRRIVQRVIAQLPWRQNIALLERLNDEQTRLWYAEQGVRHGWSQPILCLQIDSRAHERRGKALTNFKATLRDNVRAQLRVIVKRILRKYGYPPDKQEKATQTVLEQAEVLSELWAAQSE
ncbi:MAG: hypothetical protein A3G76_14410 [Acidobacteria bacterium RIFCSPLOWO2_12_FULL_65_11]|nr:MAG: hypothetical protein A3H95_02130 [Acidobacteria bacterium RIFCSPLOWO2_02_FULL_64_15]OFW30207.1 MAG: hypothetical protein A3G76_14410 [Acidobacteria bacterium RIFCSPLOWO2_12_FULL_65_11]